MEKLNKKLMEFMSSLAKYAGKPIVFAILFFATIVWFICSIFLEYDTWYDIMDVFIFLTTFFLLFIVQSSQNADTKAIQDKLDAIIEALPNASRQTEGEENKIKRGDMK